MSEKDKTSDTDNTKPQWISEYVQWCKTKPIKYENITDGIDFSYELSPDGSGNFLLPDKFGKSLLLKPLLDGSGDFLIFRDDEDLTKVDDAVLSISVLEDEITMLKLGKKKTNKRTKLLDDINNNDSTEEL